MTISRCDVVELRRYTLHPGAREALIDLFDREFVETQEAVGLHVLGQFRDLDDPDSFVWLRGFRDMPARARGLEAFYGGPVWRKHRDAARATMIDSDDVLLLRPARPDSGLALESDHRPPPVVQDVPPGLVVVTVYPLMAGAADGFREFFEREVEPVLRAAGAAVLACYRTNHSPNNYPPLPVREGEEVFVCLSLFDDEAAHSRHVAQLERSPAWHDRVSPALRERLERRPEVSRLTPTARSLLRA
jgi:quinol monooxygenase YgiN